MLLLLPPEHLQVPVTQQHCPAVAAHTLLMPCLLQALLLQLALLQRHLQVTVTQQCLAAATSAHC
jgi:hypothetical protein